MTVAAGYPRCCNVQHHGQQLPRFQMGCWTKVSDRSRHGAKDSLCPNPSRTSPNICSSVPKKKSCYESGNSMPSSQHVSLLPVVKRKFPGRSARSVCIQKSQWGHSEAASRHLSKYSILLLNQVRSTRNRLQVSRPTVPRIYCLASSTTSTFPPTSSPSVNR